MISMDSFYMQVLVINKVSEKKWEMECLKRTQNKSLSNTHQLAQKKKIIKQDKKNHKDTELTFITIYYI